MGGFAGELGGTCGKITANYAGGNVTATKQKAGGFVGVNCKNSIMDCYAVGDVTGSSDMGGFAGANIDYGSITSCYATGDITAKGDYIGGLVGLNNSNAIIINCVAANHTVLGGISNVNRLSGTNTGMFSHNYAYVDMVITPSGGNSGAKEPMATFASFNFYNTGSNWFNNSPWSIDTKDNALESWKICDGETLPFLQWEGRACDPIIIVCDFDAYGSGTQGDPYRIYEPCQLEDLATFVNQGNGAQTANKYFKLMNDIDLIDYSSGEGWVPIGDNINITNLHFQGNFDGNRKVISNLIINRKNGLSQSGFFGGIYYATILNLGIENCDITGCGNVGSLSAYTLSSIVKNCYATGNVTGIGCSITEPTGGLIGYNFFSSTIDSCYSTCNVIGNGGQCGGLTGIGNIISNSYATGDVTGARDEVGGLVGLCGSISNSYATGTVIGYSLIGGLSGASSGEITNCYVKGTVKGISGASLIGGLLGLTSQSNIRNCVAANESVLVQGGTPYYVNRIVGLGLLNATFSNNYAYDGMLVNGATVSGGTHNNFNGESKPMSTLMSYNFYNTGSNWYNNVPWNIDFMQNPSKIWGICDGKTLPFLQWQGFSCSKKSPHLLNHKDDYYSEQNRMLLTITPNPVSGMVTISATDEIQQVDIFDITGRLVKSKICTSEQITFDTSNFQSGIYFVLARLKEGEVQRGKLVVK